MEDDIDEDGYPVCGSNDMLYSGNNCNNDFIVIDNNTSPYANGMRRNYPQLAPALGGGSFLCWTSGNNNIMLKYISSEGECFFGDTINTGPGSQCAIATDSNGDIHMAYNNNGLKYRKIITI